MNHFFLAGKDSVTAETESGTVRGYQYDGISIFKGIPYAKARRFHKPEKAEPWDGVLDCTSYGYVCPLLEEPSRDNELLVPHRYWAKNENCQNLNIWTPKTDRGKRPVIVWIHGGGFETGSSMEQLAYEGENMCRLEQAVAVSVNHRLNVLGYCDLSDFGKEYDNSGNAGTEDLIAALRWIRDNIENFGGDPDNVTLVGQSGGGCKITALLQTPAADGLFHKAMIMSGISYVISDAKGSGKALVAEMMEKLGIADIKELETVPYHMLAQAYLSARAHLEKEGEYVGGAPHPNAFYMGDPLENGFRRETAGIPMIIGSAFGELSSFRETDYDKNKMTEEEQTARVERETGSEAAGKLIPLFRKAYPDRNVIDILQMDFIFREATRDYIEARSGLNNSTYSYMFNFESPYAGGTVPWHCADIPFVFHNTEMVPAVQLSGVSERIENEMFSSLIGFARHGSPDNPFIPRWPASSPEKEYVMVFGNNNSQVRCNYDHELLPEFISVMKPLEEQKLLGYVGLAEE